jgi:hypothetical protein
MIEIPAEFEHLNVKDIEQEVADGKFNHGRRTKRKV